MHRIGIRPRSIFAPNHNDQQGWCGYADDLLLRIGGGFGNPTFYNFRLAVFFTPNQPQLAAATNYHRRGWEQIFAGTAGVGGQWGWYAWIGHRWYRDPYATPPTADNAFFSGGDAAIIETVQAFTEVDPVQPVYPAGSPFAPGFTHPANAVNTLSYAVPGYENIPGGPHLLWHINMCYFADPEKVWFVEHPNPTPPMTRHWGYQHDALSWGNPESGQPPYTKIEWGYSFNTDYTWLGGTSETQSFPAQTKTFGGPHVPNWCSTFYVLLRGRSTMEGPMAASTLLGGPTAL